MHTILSRDAQRAVNEAETMANEILNETAYKNDLVIQTGAYHSHIHHYGGYDYTLTFHPTTNTPYYEQTYSGSLLNVTRQLYHLTTCFFSQDLAVLKFSDKDISRLNDRRFIIFDKSHEYVDARETDIRIIRILNAQQRIFENIKEDAFWGLKTKGALFLTTVLAAAALSLGFNQFAFSCASGIALSSAATILRYSSDNTSKRIKKIAQNILSNINELKG